MLLFYCNSPPSSHTLLLAVLAQSGVLKLNCRLINARTKSMHHIFKASEYLPEINCNCNKIESVIEISFFCMQYCGGGFMIFVIQIVSNPYSTKMMPNFQRPLT